MIYAIDYHDTIRKPTQAIAGPRQTCRANDSQHRPTTAHDSHPRPTIAKPWPMTANDTNARRYRPVITDKKTA